MIVFNGRCVVGTVAQDPATGMWLARCTLLHAGAHNCGQHPTLVAAAEAILRISGVSSVWDM